jgi:hypothetical protein
MTTAEKSGSLLFHNFSFDLEISHSALGNKSCYRCQYCGMWTDDVVFWSMRVCLKRDRRRANRRKMIDRRARNAEKENEEVQIQAIALLDVPAPKKLTGSVIIDLTT